METGQWAAAGEGGGLGSRFRITRVYMVTALVFLGAAWVCLLAGAPAVARGAWSDPLFLAAVHLFVVGYALTSVHGALLQITPVAFQGQLYSLGLGYVQYGFLVVGSVGLAAGFLSGRWHVTAAGGTLVLAAFALLLWNLGRTARTLKKRREALRSAAVLIFLFAVLIVGVGMALGEPLAGRTSLPLHMVMGITGWFTTLILILSPRLIRVFVSSRYPELERKSSERGLVAGALLIAAGVSWGWAPGPGGGWWRWAGIAVEGAGWMLYLAAYGIFLVRLFQHLRHRRRREMEWVIPWITAALVAGWPETAVWAGTVWAAGAGGDAGGRLLLGALSLMIFGFLGGVIAAYMAKILPFLRWMSKYGHRLSPAARRPPGERLVGVRDMMPRVPTEVALSGFVLGALLVSAGAWSGREELSWAGAAAGIAAWLTYTGAMAAMYRR